MKYYLTIILITLFISCNKDTNQSVKIVETIKSEKKINNSTLPAKKNKAPYELKLDLEKVNDSSYYLTAKMMLLKGAHYVSPYSKKSFKGKFNLTINPNNKIKVDDFLLSVPDSETQSIINGSLDWVKVNTIYKQQFFVNPKDNFTATGFVQFVIEPRCTFEKIPFSIIQKDGHIRIQTDGC
ncbi:hypothetical protein [Pseudofulvibacter geojedonensis]|uniref:Late embryogenesis abundant protein LEA-2 subgroup domain-containing protein n=1 Tax=Pseudofulvibacter geojedonensis TaxID=1123758 RepID=A0ABW3I111_9FLAO